MAEGSESAGLYLPDRRLSHFVGAFVLQKTVYRCFLRKEGDVRYSLIDFFFSLTLHRTSECCGMWRGALLEFGGWFAPNLP